MQISDKREVIKMRSEKTGEIYDIIKFLNDCLTDCREHKFTEYLFG